MRTLLAVSLLKDVNPLPLSPEAITDIGGSAYFLARDEERITNLWKSDGTASGTSLVARLPNLAASFPSTVQVVDFRGAPVFRTANPVDYRNELSRADPATGVVSKFVTFPGSKEEVAPETPTVAGDRLFFRSLDDFYGPSYLAGGLYVSDGTPEGTTRLAVESWTESPSIRMAALGDSVVFAATDAEHGRELWITDGTLAGTRLLADLNPGLGRSGLGQFVAFKTVGDKVVFNAIVDGITNLCVTDGTPGGTKAILPAPGAPESAVAVGDKIFFRSLGGGPTLYVSDGTPEGTRPLATPVAGSPATLVADLTAAGSSVFFTVTGGGSTELWSSDGTQAGTRSLGPVTLVPDMFSTASMSRLVGLGDSAYFSAWDPVRGTEPWRSDGTRAGTRPVADLLPGPEGSDPTNFARVGQRIYFAARDAQGGSELWSIHGTAGGPVRVAILPHAHTALSSNENSPRLALGATTYFLGRDPDHGYELWKTDGTTAGTALVADLMPGPADSSVPSLAEFGGALYFPSYNRSAAPAEILTSDGTAIGTRRAVDTAAAGVTYLSSSRLVTSGDRMYFLGTGSDGVLGLYTTDGTTGGTRRHATLPDRGQSRGDDLTAAGGHVYFTSADYAPDATFRLQLRSSRWNAPILSFPAGQGNPQILGLQEVGGLLYFNATDGLRGPRLYRSDGTPSGTFPLGDVSPGADYLGSVSIATLGAYSYFGGKDETGRIRVFRTDGTPAGTSLAIDLGPQPDVSRLQVPDGFLVVEGVLYFQVANGPRSGLYRSDGTQEGTSRVVSSLDLGGAPASSRFGPLRDLGGSIGFTFSDGYSDGYSTYFYRSDGTRDGTVSLGRIGGLYGSGSPAADRRQPGDILIFADDGLHGTEPMIVGNSPGMNLPPAIAYLPDVIAFQGRSVRFAASASDRDPGQSIRFVLAPGAPDGATIDPETGAFSWDVPAGFPTGTYRLVVVATDDAAASESDVKRFYVRVREAAGAPNRAPSLDAIPDLSVDQGRTLAHLAVGADPDPGQALTYSLDPGAPEGATIDPATGAFRYTPSGPPASASVTIRVTDDGASSQSTTRTFRLVVRNVGPTITLDGAATATAEDPFRLPGRAADPGGDAVAATVDYGDGSGVQPLSLAGDGSFLLQHAYAIPGGYIATVTAVDAFGAATSATVRLDVLPKRQVPGVAGVFAFAEPAFAAGERAGLATITVVRLGGGAGVETVAYATADGSARGGSAYVPTAGILSFGPGETSKTFTVPILDDGLATGARSLSLVLSDPGGGATLGSSASSTLTILDDGPVIDDKPIIDDGLVIDDKPIVDDKPVVPPVSVVKITPAIRRGRLSGLVIQFSGPVRGDAEGPRHFRLGRVVMRGRKASFKPVGLRRASFDATTNTARLSLRKRLPSGISLRLIIDSAGITDLLGRPLDGDRDGTPGGGGAAKIRGRVAPGNRGA